jgi:thiosulfate reductase / polysulfide reductase chain A
MGKKISRRNFLKATGGVAGAVTATGAIAGAQPFPPGWKGDSRVELIPTNCEMCFWRCGVLAEVQVAGQSGAPAHERQIMRARKRRRGAAE